LAHQITSKLVQAGLRTLAHGLCDLDRCSDLVVACTSFVGQVHRVLQARMAIRADGCSYGNQVTDSTVQSHMVHISFLVP
jgi:hypothetical protein